MAYQPLYATVSDINGMRGTHSVRQRVEWVRGWLNSYYGTVLTYNASYHEPDKPYIERKGKTLEEYRKEKEQAEQEHRKNTKITIDITLEKNPHYEYRINGITLTDKDIEILEKAKMEEFKGKLAVMSAFALIPDIKRIVEAETNKERKEAVETFKQKRNGISKVLKEM